MSNDIGDLVRLFVTFKDEAGAVADPTTVTLTLKAPDGTPSEPALESHVDDTGYYEALVEPDQSGWWYVRWEGTGTVMAAEEYSFHVRLRHVPEPVGS